MSNQFIIEFNVAWLWLSTTLSLSILLYNFIFDLDKKERTISEKNITYIKYL